MSTMEIIPPVTDVYLEVGAKRTFAGVIAWPGWCRSGGDEAAALVALAAVAPYYARVLQQARRVKPNSPAVSDVTSHPSPW